MRDRGEVDDRVNAVEELAAKDGADEARRTGDENAHVRTAERGAPPPFGATPDSSKPLSAGSRCHYNTRSIETLDRASDNSLLPRDSFRRIGHPPVADVAAASPQAIPAPRFQSNPASGHGAAGARFRRCPRPDRRFERRAPVSRRRADARNRREARDPDTGACGSQHRTRDRGRGAPPSEPLSRRLNARAALRSPHPERAGVSRG